MPPTSKAVDISKRVKKKLAIKKYDLLYWFKDTKLIEEGAIVVVSDPSADRLKYIKKHHGSHIRDALQAVGRGDATVQWKVAKGNKPATAEKQKATDDRADDERPYWSALKLDDAEPWAEKVNGQQVLSDVARLISRFVVLPRGAADALALWCLHTFALDATCISPIVAPISPVKRCGKTTLLTLIYELVRRPLTASSISPAALYRTVAYHTPTLLLDEADCWLRDNDELRGLLNAGHTKRTASVIRMTGKSYDKPVQFSTWCAKLVALIGSLPDTLEDRAIVIPMRRKARTEQVERLRQHAFPQECGDLRRKLRRWAEDEQGYLETIDPDIPDQLNDRAADNWRPLLAIADRAGGDWPERARAAASQLSETDDNDEQTITIALLADMRDIFEGADFCPTARLLDALKRLDERPWATYGPNEKGLSGHMLARLLRGFRVYATNSGSERGYRRDGALTDAWERYLTPSQSVKVSKHQQNRPQSPLLKVSNRRAG